MKGTPLKAEEKLTGHLYGAGFSLFDDQEFKSVIQPIIERFKKNKIPLETFKNKVCLDAGCGGGRGTIFVFESFQRNVIFLETLNNRLNHAFEFLIVKQRKTSPIKMPRQFFLGFKRNLLHIVQNF